MRAHDRRHIRCGTLREPKTMPLRNCQSAPRAHCPSVGGRKSPSRPSPICRAQASIRNVPRIEIQATIGWKIPEIQTDSEPTAFPRWTRRQCFYG